MIACFPFIEPDYTNSIDVGKKQDAGRHQPVFTPGMSSIPPYKKCKRNSIENHSASAYDDTLTL